MTAKIEINFGDALTSDELGELLELASEERKPLGRIAYEGITHALERRRAARAAEATRPSAEEVES